MNTYQRTPLKARYVTVAALLLTLGGCGGFPNFGSLFSFPDLSGLFSLSRITDGGGGNLISAGLKVLNGQLSMLSQDEVQSLSDQARGLIGALAPELPIGPEMTNAQADAFIEFLTANNVNRFEDVARLTENPLGIVIPPSLITAYLGTNIMVDSGNVDVNALFGNVFTGL